MWFQGFPHDRAPFLMDAVRDSGGLLLSTSRGESFGMAIAEAMARRCPVAAPALGPFPDYIVDGVNGMLFRAGSTDRAVAAVRALVQDGELREQCGRRAREDILSVHSPDRALEGLAEELRAARSSSEAAGIPADRLPSLAEP